MFLHTLMPLVLLGLLALGTLLIHWRMLSASNPLHPRAEKYALSLTIDIYNFVCTDTESSFLLSITPSRQEKEALARVVAEVARCITECNPEQVGRLSQAWGLEEICTRRIESRSGYKRSEAFEILLLLQPSKECVEHIARRHFAAPSHALSQLLLVIHTAPEQVEMLLARHPHSLGWSEMERIVVVLKRHTQHLSPPSEESVDVCQNIALYSLYLAAVEGVGNARKVAEKLTTNNNKTVRNAAFNVLLQEALYPSLQEFEIGS